MPINLPSATKPINAVVSLPGSKSITNRALLMAALANGESRLTGLLSSDDTHAFAKALQSLGVQLDWNKQPNTVVIEGGKPFCDASVWCQDAGTAARFLLAACALHDGVFQFDGTGRLRERPMRELCGALRELGAEISADQFPVEVKGSSGLTGGEIIISGGESSQFVSALLMTAPLLQNDLSVKINTMKRRAYINLTCDIMAAFGVAVTKQDNVYHVARGQSYQSRDFIIEPDLSTASYFFAAAAVTQGRVKVKNLQRDQIKQGDVRFLNVLEAMGCSVLQEDDGVVVEGPEKLKGQDINMQDFSDTFMTLACVAPFAEGPTKITGIGHTRLQESDRIDAIAGELVKLGCTVEAGGDWLRVYPKSQNFNTAFLLESCNDHRVAMSLAIIGLRVAGLKLINSDCVAKTCPDFFKRFWGLVGS